MNDTDASSSIHQLYQLLDRESRSGLNGFVALGGIDALQQRFQQDTPFSLFGTILRWYRWFNVSERERAITLAQLALADQVLTQSDLLWIEEANNKAMGKYARQKANMLTKLALPYSHTNEIRGLIQREVAKGCYGDILSDTDALSRKYMQTVPPIAVSLLKSYSRLDIAERKLAASIVLRYLSREPMTPDERRWVIKHLSHPLIKGNVRTKWENTLSCSRWGVSQRNTHGLAWAKMVSH